MTPSITFPQLALFGRAKLREYGDRVRQIAAYSFEHFLFIGGHASIAYGAYTIWHPLGPILGGWFAIKLAMLFASDK